jgi:hypothetical protein
MTVGDLYYLIMMWFILFLENTYYNFISD